MTLFLPARTLVTRADLRLPSEVHAARHELRFARLTNPSTGYAFPCNAKGKVHLAELDEGARASYLYARANLGREFATPVVRLRKHCGDTVILDHSG